MTKKLADEIEYIEWFDIPILSIKGLAFKNNIRYVALRDVHKALNRPYSIFHYPFKKVELIHGLEVIPKQEYNQKVKGHASSNKFVGSPTLTLISLEDLLQVLNILQSRKDINVLVKNLLLKTTEFREKLNGSKDTGLHFLTELLFKLDDIAFEFICKYEDKWLGYQALWDSPIWGMIISTIREKRELLGLEVPPERHTGLHHLDEDKPYRLIYPYVATKGHLIDKRFNHDDPRNRRYL